MAPCPGCGVELDDIEGPTHAYIGSSAACWARFGELLAREYQDPEWFRPHQVTVDAYAAQHPGKPERRSIQSVAMHLMTLGMALERGMDPADAPALHRRMTDRPEYVWLEPPPLAGRLNVLDVLQARSPEEHERRVWAWGADVWDAWAPHHAQVWEWLEASLGG
jgi:hypothetical protein